MRLPLLPKFLLQTSSTRISLLVLSSCLAAGAQTSSQPPIAQLVDSLSAVRAPETAALSPDGASVAWTYDGPGGSELHLASLQAAAPDRRILPPSGDHGAAAACSAAHPAWSPDSTQLAFLSTCTGTPATPDPSKQENLWLWSPATNSYRQLSHLHGNLSDLQWSPDGKSIAFLYVENATRKAGALDAMKPWSGVIGEDGVEVQRVFSIEVATGSGNWLTPEDLHVYEFSEAPDTGKIAFVAANPPGENNWWVAKLYTAPTDQEVPFKPTVAFDPNTTPGPLHGLQIAVPRFSPDGKTIAFIGGLMSDQGATGGDIYLIPASGQPTNTPPGAAAIPKDLTLNRPASPAWIAWRNDHQLLVTEHSGGSSHITALDTATGKDDPAINLTLPETIIAGTDVMSLSVAQNATASSNTGSFAFIRQSFAHPPEVWAGPLDHLTQISHLNDTLAPQWGKAESVTWTNDGRHIQGWLLYPANYDPARKYPLIVSVHGGPSSAVTPRWPEASYGAVPFSALGYFVFLPNPRGSYGQGEAFTQANIKDFGYGDLHDILAGLDTLEKRLPIDPAREGLTGWSYGGFMTMFAVTQTTRFHAAVAGAGIANWQSYYGENSIDQWMTPFFGATVYNDPAVYARSSAIDFIKHVRTPTLVVVGDRDGECPAPQSFEFWHALRSEGVPTQLVVYPNEGHRFADPAHRKDVLQRALNWFNTQMPAPQ